MLHAEIKDGAVVVRVRVQPKASRNTVVGEYNGALKVAVTVPPEKGKANAAVVDLLARALGIARGCIEIVAGTTSRDKTVAIRGVTKGEVEALIGTRQ